MNVRRLAARFAWGLSRPAGLLLALRHNKSAFRAAMKSALVQVFATLVLAGAVMAFRADELVDSTKKVTERISENRAQLRAPKQPGPPGGDPIDETVTEAAVTRAVASLEEQLRTTTGPAQKDDLEAALGALKEQLQGARESRALAEAAKMPATELDAEAAERVTEAIEAKIERVSAERERATTPAQKAIVRQALSELRRDLKRSRERETANEVAEALRDAEAGVKAAGDEITEDEEKLPVWRRFWALAVSAIFAAQWVVLALARDYQDRTSRELALTAGIEPEEDDIKPRVRIDWKWLRRKLRRRVRGAMVLVPGFLLASPIFLLARISGFTWLSSIVTGAWTFYWWMVFSAARTGRAWLWEKSAPPNAPLRWYLQATQTTPGLRWWGPRFVGWVWVRMTRSMFSPAMAVELDFAAFAGLSLARLIGNVPLIRVFVRPAMSVVAAEIVIQRAVAAAPLLSTATLESVMEPPQRAKDQAGV